jgi:HK97 family phage major capsid protein
VTPLKGAGAVDRVALTAAGGIDYEAEHAKMRKDPNWQDRRRAVQAEFEAEKAADQAASVERFRNRPAPFRDQETLGVMERGRTLIQVGRGEYIYRPDNEYNCRQFIRDLSSFSSDSAARERLTGNNRQFEMQAAGVTQGATTGGEFVPPVYMLERFAPALRAGRPFLNALGTLPLPPRTNSLNFPKFTSGATVAVQTDAAAPSNTDPVTTSVVGQVQTEAGRTIASFQFLDLNPLAAETLLKDLAFAYHTALDTASLTGAVTNAKGLLNVAGVNTQTYTDASPTASEFWVPVSQAAAQIGKNAGLSPDFAVTHPSIGWFIQGGSDTTNLRPLYVGLGSGSMMIGAANGSDQPALPDGSTGLFSNVAGLPLCFDPNMPVTLGAGTNESRIVLVSRLGFELYEGPPFLKITEQTGASTLQATLMCYGYYAAVSRQPKALTIISGTGCIVQAGW